MHWGSFFIGLGAGMAITLVAFGVWWFILTSPGSDPE